MDVFLLILRLSLAGVFGVAGLAKLFDRAGSVKALNDFGVPAPLAKPLVSLLPVVELAIAVGLLFITSSWYAALGAAGLLAVFSVAMVYQFAKGNAPDCHCFGQIHSEPVGVTSIFRNVALLAIAGFLVSRGQSGQGFSLVRSDQDVLIAVAAIAAIVLLGSVLLSLTSIARHQTQIIRRIELMELVARDGESVERNEISHPHEGLPIGAVVPDFALTNLDGDVVSLADIRQDGLPVIFCYVSPTCTPCGSLVPDFTQWVSDLDGKAKVVLVSSGTEQDNREKFGELAAVTLLQKDREFADLVKAQWTPTAVLMGADGRIASHLAAGDTAIRDLVEQIKSDIRESKLKYVTNGHSHSQTTKLGKRVPDFSARDISGNEITSEYFRDRKTLVAFWSLDCSYCDRMIDELREWDKAKGMDEPGLIVFSDGDIEANRGLGLASPVVVDEGQKISTELGMFGTPSAVLVNEDGVIISETAMGAQDIWALVDKRK